MPAPLDPDEKKRFVREKFASISARYDLLNSVLSLHVDHYWRWRLNRLLRDRSQGWVLDLCAGTLPLSLVLIRRAPGRRILAVDFCEDMLRKGMQQLSPEERKRIHPVCGDGENIPAPSNSFEACTVAFGVRNLSRTLQGLREMRRVLKPGGKLLILEFSRPSNPLIKPIYTLYLHKILPLIAGSISGDTEAYTYLGSSINAFHEPQALLELMVEAGFEHTSRQTLTFGIVSIYLGVKKADV